MFFIDAKSNPRGAEQVGKEGGIEGLREGICRSNAFVTGMYVSSSAAL